MRACVYHNEKKKRARQWGLFTKWRRSGSAGHFCTRVRAGCMARCVRPRKFHLRRATFCSFCLNTLRVILTNEIWVRRTWKIKPEKELEQGFSIFFGSMTSEQCGTQNNVQHCRLAWQWHGLRLSATNNAFGWVLFSQQKRVSHLAFWLFWFCVCGYWLLSPSSWRPPRVCQLWLTCIRYMCSWQR